MTFPSKWGFHMNTSLKRGLEVIKGKLLLETFSYCWQSCSRLSDSSLHPYSLAAAVKMMASIQGCTINVNSGGQNCGSRGNSNIDN